MTKAARWILRAALVLLFWSCVVVWFCVSSGCARAPVSVGCHPGQHRCQTDAECEDEEAYFLDVKEGDDVERIKQADLRWNR